MEIHINTIDDLINFVESHDLTNKEINEILAKTETRGIFIYDHTPHEYARLLKEYFKADEPRIFIDLENIGVIEDDPND